MSTTIEIKDSTYGKLLAKSLPRPIHSESEHARLTGMLLQLDEREDLSPEEEALAEVLTLLIEDYEKKPSASPRLTQRIVAGADGRTRVEAQGHLARPRQQRSCHRGVEWPPVYQQGAGKAACRVLSRSNRPLHLSVLMLYY